MPWIACCKFHTYLISSNDESKSSAELIEQCEALSGKIEDMLPEKYSYNYLLVKKDAVSVVKLEEGKTALDATYVALTYL